MELERLKVVPQAALSVSADILARCRASQQAEESGDLEGARAVLDRWQRVGERPNLDGLSVAAKAELLLRVGILTSRLGSAKRLSEAQEIAKDLLTESIVYFEEVGLNDRALDAHIYIAACCVNQARFDDARIMLQQILRKLPEDALDSILRARSWLGVTEYRSRRYQAALEVHEETRRMVGRCQSEYHKGTFLNAYAHVLEATGRMGEALLEYTAAGVCYETIGNLRFKAIVDNNTSHVFWKLKRYTEAHDYANRARAYFASRKDVVLVARTDETRAKIFIGEQKYLEALKVIKSAVRILEEHDQPAILTEALTTYGVALARVHNTAQARTTFERAASVAREVGDKESEGRALLATLTEVPDAERDCEIFREAKELLKDSQDASMAEQLLDVAALLISRMKPDHKPDLDAISEGAVPDISFWEGFSLADAKNQFVKKMVVLALKTTGGNARQASKLLGMEKPSRIYQLIEEFGLDDLQQRHHARSVMKPEEAQAEPPQPTPIERVVDIREMLEFKLPPGVDPADSCVVHQLTTDVLKDKGAVAGDWVLVRRGPVEEGDWVGADIPGEPYQVGRLATVDGCRCLLPANPKMSAACICDETAVIEGEIVGRLKGSDVSRYKKGRPVKSYPF